MEEVNFKGSDPKPIGEYKPYVPATVKLLSITQGFSLPLVSSESGGPKPASAVYSIGDGALTVGLALKITDQDGGSSVETPLAMCKYVKPDGDNVYDAEICREATFTNISREAHNTFVVKLVNAFITSNDLGTSAGKMTCPDPPADCNKMRLEAIKKLTSDKLGTTKRAIKFLAEHEIYCGKDYEFDHAFETANEQSFMDICKKRAETGKVRVRLEGCPPSWWDGHSLQDSAGHYVAWKKGDGHTFLTPSVLVVRALAPVIAETPLLITGNEPLAIEDAPLPEKTEEESFDKLDFARGRVPLKALTLPAQ